MNTKYVVKNCKNLYKIEEKKNLNYNSPQLSTLQLKFILFC